MSDPSVSQLLREAADRLESGGSTGVPAPTPAVTLPSPAARDRVLASARTSAQGKPAMTEQPHSAN